MKMFILSKVARTFIRLTRRYVSLRLPEYESDTNRMLESFIPTGHLYGIDYGNIDPAWYRAK